MSVALALNSSKEIWPSPSVSYLAMSTEMRSESTSVKEPALTSRLDISAIWSKAWHERKGQRSRDGSGAGMAARARGISRDSNPALPLPQPLPNPHLPQLERVDLAVAREAVHPVEDILPQHQALALVQVRPKRLAERIGALRRARVRVGVGLGARARGQTLTDQAPELSATCATSIVRTTPRLRTSPHSSL